MFEIQNKQIALDMIVPRLKKQHKTAKLQSLILTGDGNRVEIHYYGGYAELLDIAGDSIPEMIADVMIYLGTLSKE